MCSFPEVRSKFPNNIVFIIMGKLISNHDYDCHNDDELAIKANS